MTTLSHNSSKWRTLRELWRSHKMSFVVTTSVVALTGLYLSLFAAPSVYRAEAFLVVPPAEGSVDLSMRRTFSSEITHPAVLTSAAEDIGRLAPDATPMARQAVVNELKSRLQVVVRGGAAGKTEIRIASVGHNREELSRLVNATAQAYVSDYRKDHQVKAEKVATLRKEVATLSEDFEDTNGLLTSATTALEAFRTKNLELGGDPDAAFKAIVEQQKAGAEALEKTQAEVDGLEAAERLLRTRLKDVPQFVETHEVTTIRDPERVALEREIRMMERQLQEMLRTYTYKHPEIISRQTDLLMKRRQLRELKQRVEDSVKRSRKQNPEYEVLKAKLDDVVVELQGARSTLNRLTARKKTLEKDTDNLRRLAGSHRILKGQLADLEKRHAAQKTALDGKREALNGAVRAVKPVPGISMLAKTPSTPVGPRRWLHLLGAAVVSVFAGTTAMSAAFRLSNGLASEYELARVTGLSPAGNISAVAGTEAHRRGCLRKRMRAGFLLVLVVLVTGAALVMVSRFAGALKGGS